MQSKESYKFVNGNSLNRIYETPKIWGFWWVKGENLEGDCGNALKAFILPTVLTSHLYEMFFFLEMYFLRFLWNRMTRKCLFISIVINR